MNTVNEGAEVTLIPAKCLTTICNTDF